MDEIPFTWFDNVENGSAIFHVFKMIAGSSCKESYEVVANAAKMILAVIKNVEV